MSKVVLLSTVALATCSFGSAASAQTSPAADASQAAGEIVVTAQRRQERLQDVPISVTAIGGPQLKSARIDSGTEIARQTPNVRVSVLGDESQPKFAIRGISTPEFNLNAISPTGIFYDEVYVGASYLGGAQIFDIERVEVLRGPQGTLFGKNTTAGAINFVSRAPQFRNELELSAGYGSHNYYEAKGAGEAVIVDDRLSARLAFNVAHSDGYVENLNPAGRDLSNIDRKAVRLSLGFKNADGDFNGTLRLFGNWEDARAIGAINTGTGPGGLNAAGLNPRVNPLTGKPLGDRQVVTDRSGDIEVRGAGGYLTLNKDLGFATLTSLTSYLHGRFLNLVDADGTIAPLIHIDFGAKTNEFSQDLRLAFKDLGSVHGTIGLYHQRDDIDINTVYLLFGGPPVFPVLTQQYEQKRRSYAVYADGSVDLADQLSVYGGIRYTWDKGRLYNFQVVPIIPLQSDRSYDDHQPTGRLGVQFKPSRDVMFYGQYARGYRSSAVNGGALTNPADLNVARPEKLDAYEVGAKTQFLDRRITLNASGFLYNFRDQQFLNVVGIGNQQLVNAGKSRVKGVEVEARVSLSRELSVSGGMGLLDSEYRQLNLNGVDLSGKELIEAPHATFNFAGDYNLPVGRDGAIILHGDATHVSSQYFSPTNTADFRVGGFWDVGARLAFREPSGRFEFAVYGKNLTNNTKSTGIQIDPTTMTRFTTVPYPRRYGLEVTARFK
jgi:iron complex outermembrane recepter protein